MKLVPWVLFVFGIIGLALVNGFAFYLPSESVDEQTNPSAKGDCGILALSSICHAERLPHSLKEFQSLTQSPNQGTNLLQLKRVAVNLGFEAQGVKTNFGDLRNYVQTPHHYAILHFQRGHFVAVLGSEADRIQVADNGQSMQSWTEAELQNQGWSQIALLLHHSKATDQFLKCDPYTIALKDVPVNTQQSFSTTIHNISDKPIFIGSLHSGCTCTDVKLSNPHIQPGEKSTLSGTYRSSDKTGTTRSKISIQVVQPVEKVIDLELTANVIRTITLNPENLSLQPQFLDNQSDSTNLILQNTWNKEIQIISVQCTDPQIKLTNNQNRFQPGETIRIGIEAPPKYLSVENSELIIHTDHPSESQIRVPIQIRPTPQLTVVPKEIRLGVLSKEEFTKRFPMKIQIIGPTLSHFDVASIQVPTFLKASSEKNQSGNLITIKLDKDPQSSLTGISVSAVMEIHLKDRQTNRICALQVPLSGILRDAD